MDLAGPLRPKRRWPEQPLGSRQVICMFPDRGTGTARLAGRSPQRRPSGRGAMRWIVHFPPAAPAIGGNGSVKQPSRLPQPSSSAFLSLLPRPRALAPLPALSPLVSLLSLSLSSLDTLPFRVARLLFSNSSLAFIMPHGMRLE